MIELIDVKKDTNTFLFPTKSRQQNVSLSCPRKKSGKEWKPTDKTDPKIYEDRFFYVVIAHEELT